MEYILGYLAGIIITIFILRYIEIKDNGSVKTEDIPTMVFSSAVFPLLIIAIIIYLIGIVFGKFYSWFLNEK